ncbi:uncharacterized protein LOC141512143 [Macrotis lagotis]|uniref:uncharacterized protein LOC141512143 n=1 Tax=Macrotis lagotis TaxID=92651 RepID=UPI003D685D58
MATRRSQRRKGRRGELGTALLPTLVLALGLSLACFGLLLVVISLGTQASPFSQDLAQQEMVEEKEAEAVMQMISQRQNLAPTLKRRVRLPRAVKGHRARIRKVNAAHYEVRAKSGLDGAQAGMDGTVSGWEEAKINSTNPLSYDAKSAQFTVTRAGLYYLYCQVHFDEGKAVYLKLDLLVDGSLALRCLEEFSATAASSPGPQLRLCQVSGLLLLRPGVSLKIRTLPLAHLKAAPFLTYFGLFQHTAASRVLRLVMSPSLLSPRPLPGQIGGPSRDPVLLVSLWVSWGTALGVAACVVALLTQQAELQTLREEVAQLKGNGGSHQKGNKQPLLIPHKQGIDELEALKDEEMSRRKREVLSQELRHKRKRSVLHLIPINSTSREESDVTEIMWEPALRHGGGLEPQGHVVGVRETGMYFLYSQVLFHDVTFTMGQVVYRDGQGREILSRCICSMPSNLHQAYNSCYTAGVFHLYQGDILSLTIPRAGAKLDLTPHGTFLGLVKL